MQKTSLEQIEIIKGFLRKSLSTEEKTVEQVRKEVEVQATSVPIISGIKAEKTHLAGLKAEWVKADNVPENSIETILYFHGGAFISGTCESFRDIASRLSKASGVRVLTVEYRLAPEYKYPAANDDCLAAYKALLDSGISAEKIILGGDSIGGYLVLMTLLSLRNAGILLPKAAFLLSPHTDFLYYDGESYTSRASLDPTNNLQATKRCADNYFEPQINDTAILAPLYEDLRGLSELFIQVGDHEVILSDSTRLAERAKAAGVKVELEIWDNMWHIFRLMAYMLPEGQQAINNIGEFVRKVFFKNL